MDALTLTAVGFGALLTGSLLGYVARQYIVKRQAGSIEKKLQDRIAQVEEERKTMLEKAKQEAQQVSEQRQKEDDERRKGLLETEQLLLKREQSYDKKLSELESRESDLQKKVEGLKETEKGLEDERSKILKRLEEVSSLSQEDAKEELFQRVGEQYEQDLLGRMRKMESEGKERYDARAKDIITHAIQRYASSQAQEVTTTTVVLPSEEVKGKIIGKEGRNIRSLERASGVEIVVDEAPEAVVISGFDPVRRHIAKIALERLIQDGRIHPARVEEEVARAQEDISQQIKEAGETAIYDTGLVGVDPKLVQLLGRLKFRTSHGQNVLLHSIEVAHLASAIASEVGADSQISKRAGLFHDIGKALDHQMEGSHVEIGIRILDKFGVDKAVIDAMKSHHEDYPYESIEAIIVQASDAISASRPGARKDTLENYLKRIGELEKLASSFDGVEKAYAIQAGREIRIFVKPERVSDVEAHQLARDMASKIQDELRYPGEIKVTLVRENRFVEYAK